MILIPKVIQALWRSTRSNSTMTALNHTRFEETRLGNMKCSQYKSLFKSKLKLVKDKESTRTSIKIGTNENKSNLNLSVKSVSSVKQQSNVVRVKESRKQIIKMLLVIILVFSLCWCPRQSVTLLKRARLRSYNQIKSKKLKREETSGSKYETQSFQF